MNIFYDHQAFSLQDYGGITRIFSELVKGIKKRGYHAHLSLLYSNNIHLKENNLDSKTILNSIPFLKKRKIVYIVNELYNIYDIRKTSFTIYHPTYYSPNLIKYAKNKPIVATFHDMIHEKFSNKFIELKKDKKLIEQKKSLAQRATRIIAVSENTKQDLIEMYGIEPSKIKVIYLGSSFSSSTIEINSNKSKPYLLYVGNRGVYKNFTPFLKAISPLLIQYQLFLICAGGKEFSKQEKELMQVLGINGFVNQLPTNDKLLSQLYTNAIAFVFPSLYEGFGIPVLEAFSCNCPCVLSNTSSLPEIGGNAAVYIDPYDPNSMYNVVETIINNNELRKKLTELGQIRLKNFSWNRHIDQTLDLYSELV